MSLDYENRIEYATFAIEANKQEFGYWLEAYLQAMSTGGYCNLEDGLYEGDEHFFRCSCNVINYLVRFKQLTAEDLELTLFNDPTDARISPHLEKLSQAIAKKWDVASMPFSIVNIVKDPVVATILESRWYEAERTFNARAYLSTVVLLGSILEGLLYYKLKDKFEEVQEKAHSKVFRQGQLMDINNLKNWSLTRLIEIAHICRWVDSNFTEYNNMLKNYRNLIHPANHIKNYKDVDINKQLCDTLKTVVAGSLDHLRRN